MIRRPPRSTHCISSAASDVYKRQPINPAISLHSPYDEERKEIMPIAKKYTIKELMDACRYYISKTNRRVTFEYALIKDKNNTDREAKKLVELLRGMLCLSLIHI